jgi:hypothetical protein
MLGPGKERELATQIADGRIIDGAAPVGWSEGDRRFKIFVSYSRGDSSDFAIALVAALEHRGLAAQVDTRDLEFGEKWQAQLRDFIRQADAAGAAAIIRLAVSPELEGRTGLYFDRTTAARANPQAYDRAARERLRALSFELTGLAPT